MKLTSAHKNFIKKIWAYYEKNKRAMPWRETRDPYKIWLSEIMLQQTQVDRVREKYVEFLSAFPTVHALAVAPTAEVLRVWKGLGYNRRALYVQRAAQLVVGEYDGIFPQTIEALDSLPGVGHATACAIATYAFGEAAPFIETNIRSVFLHHFFAGKTNVPDSSLLPHIVVTLDTKNPREWYYALMDYGSMLKKTRVNPSRASKHYARQSTFKGSDRELRGKLLEYFLSHAKSSSRTVCVFFNEYDDVRVVRVLADLIAEGFIHKQGSMLSLTRSESLAVRT